MKFDPKLINFDLKSVETKMIFYFVMNHLVWDLNLNNVFY